MNEGEETIQSVKECVSYRGREDVTSGDLQKAVLSVSAAATPSAVTLHMS